MLYARGIFVNRCFDELNLDTPASSRVTHQEYVEAGAGRHRDQHVRAHASSWARTASMARWLKINREWRADRPRGRRRAQALVECRLHRPARQAARAFGNITFADGRSPPP